MVAVEFLSALKTRLTGELPGLALEGDALAAPLSCRYGELTLEIDYDVDAESVRVGVAFPPPPGAGADFLVFLLATNTQYWDVKAGLDEEGMFTVHSDLDADSKTEEALTVLIALILDRAETIGEYVSEIADWLGERELGTPQQIARWTKE